MCNGSAYARDLAWIEEGARRPAAASRAVAPRRINPTQPDDEAGSGPKLNDVSNGKSSHLVDCLGTVSANKRLETLCDRQFQRCTPGTLPSPPSQPPDVWKHRCPWWGRNPDHKIISVSVRSRTQNRLGREGASEILDQKVSCGEDSEKYGDNVGSPHQGLAPSS